jgi:plastocyanin
MRRGFLLLCLAASLAAPAAAGELRGRVGLALPGLTLPDVGPVVVYLESDKPIAAPAPKPAEMRQQNARFSPAFLAVARGTDVAMPNDDAIYHNAFSFSSPNDFDLGLYPAGESRAVAFQHPGLVKIFCSIHEAMNGTVFVAPTPWFAVVDADGSFRIRSIPRGKFHLRTWAEKLPPIEKPVSIGAGTATIDLTIGAP